MSHIRRQENRRFHMKSIFENYNSKMMTLIVPWRSCGCACCQGMWWSGGIVPLIFSPSMRWGKWSTSLALLLYCLGESLRYPLNRTLCMLQIWYGHLGEEKNLLLVVVMKPQFLGMSSLYPNHYTIYTILACWASYCETVKVMGFSHHWC